MPLESDLFRCTPEGKLRVYMTRNAGESWEPLTRGLPQKNAMETVLRDSLATDTCDPAGVYFGTRSGKVYGSSDNGKSWQTIAEGLPAVVCVKAAWVGDDGKNLPRRHRGTEKKRVARQSRARLKQAEDRGRQSIKLLAVRGLRDNCGDHDSYTDVSGFFCRRRQLARD